MKFPQLARHVDGRAATVTGGTLYPNLYHVILGDGRKALWYRDELTFIEPKALQDVVQNKEDNNVTKEREARGGGLKYDAGLTQPRLLHEGMPLALAEVIKTLDFGARKYAAHSWQKVENGIERYQDAGYRHDAKRCQGEVYDKDSGLRHRAHKIVNELFVLELELRAEEEAGVSK